MSLTSYPEWSLWGFVAANMALVESPASKLLFCGRCSWADHATNGRFVSELRYLWTHNVVKLDTREASGCIDKGSVVAQPPPNNCFIKSIALSTPITVRNLLTALSALPNRRLMPRLSLAGPRWSSLLNISTALCATLDAWWLPPCNDNDSTWFMTRLWVAGKKVAGVRLEFLMKLQGTLPILR